MESAGRNASSALTSRCWMNVDYFSYSSPCQPPRTKLPFTVWHKHGCLFRVMSSFPALARKALCGSAPFSRGVLKEDNHMPILPTMTCPKHVLEVILLLILMLANNVYTSSNLTPTNPKPSSQSGPQFEMSRLISWGSLLSKPPADLVLRNSLINEDYFRCSLRFPLNMSHVIHTGPSRNLTVFHFINITPRAPPPAQ